MSWDVFKLYGDEEVVVYDNYFVWLELFKKGWEFVFVGELFDVVDEYVCNKKGIVLFIYDEYEVFY